jgi:hypothetical protein
MIVDGKPENTFMVVNLTLAMTEGYWWQHGLHFHVGQWEVGKGLSAQKSHKTSFFTE